MSRSLLLQPYKGLLLVVVCSWQWSNISKGCYARISTPEAQLGLPKLTPGCYSRIWRYPTSSKACGVALEMMLLSKPIPVIEGVERGLIDAIVSPEELISVSRHWALDIAQRRKPWISSLHRTDKLSPLSEAHEILKVATEQVKRTAPNMPQHHGCLAAIKEGAIFSGYAGVFKICT